MLLIKISCRWCGLIFCICRSCFRGQAYCGDPCRIAGKRKNHREAQRKYRQSDKGKKAHRNAENRRRHGLIPTIRKNMDDASSTPLSKRCIRELCRFSTHLFHEKNNPYCHFCGCDGQIVDQFPRRGYG